MAYVKTNWLDNETPLSAANLNKIEQGIKNVDDGLSGVVADLATDKSNLESHLADYSTFKSDTLNFVSDYEYQPSTVVSRQIRTTKLSSTDIVKFKLDTNIAEGEGIIISLDGGATSMPLMKIDGTTPVTKLKQGFHEVIADATFFTFVSKGDYNIGDKIEPAKLYPIQNPWGIVRAGNNAAINVYRGLSANRTLLTAGVANGSPSRLYIYPHGMISGTLTANISINGSPTNAYDVFVSDDGKIYVMTSTYTIDEYDADGTHIRNISGANVGYALMYVKDEFLYTCNQSRATITKFNLSTLTVEWSTQLHSSGTYYPNSFYVDGKDRIVAGYERANQVVLDQNGTILFNYNSSNFYGCVTDEDTDHVYIWYNYSTSSRSLYKYTLAQEYVGAVSHGGTTTIHPIGKLGRFIICNATAPSMKVFDSNLTEVGVIEGMTQVSESRLYPNEVSHACINATNCFLTIVDGFKIV